MALNPRAEPWTLVFGARFGVLNHFLLVRKCVHEGGLKHVLEIIP